MSCARRSIKDLMPGEADNEYFGVRQCIGYIINYEKRFCQLNIGLLIGLETGPGAPKEAVIMYFIG
jgi:hypothetical protein